MGSAKFFQFNNFQRGNIIEVGHSLLLVEASTLGPLAFGGPGPQITYTLFGGIVAP